MTEHQTRPGTVRESQPGTAIEIPWCYEAPNGPDQWGSLDPAFAICDSGLEQSPINLTGAIVTELNPVEFHYGETPVTVRNTGRSIQVDPASGSFIIVDGTRFDLVQFHFHHHSEHLVDDRSLPLELHLVHQSEKGCLAVIGVLFREGETNETLAFFWEDMPTISGTSCQIPGELDLGKLLPTRGRSWRYRGSLTTPPCTEGVKWVIFTDPLSMSATQISKFAEIYPCNCRPVQPIGQRDLLVG